jgi:signal transduction histidine kinase/tetratricopeptide (TPR) repeat protein
VNKILDWQKKAIILFAFIVLVISVILTVFAIREAERDKLVKQNETEQEQERIAASIVAQVASKIRRVEEQFFGLLGPDRYELDEKQLDEAAARLKKSENMVAEIFYLDDNGRINFPLFEPLYRLDRESESIKRGPLAIEDRELFRSAEEQEFKARDYSLAIRDYRQLLRSTSDRISHALLLNRIARCYKLSGRTDRAAQIYEQIVKDYPYESSPDGIPFSLIAMYQMGVLSSDRDNLTESIEAHLGLYHALLESRWTVNQAQFTYYLREVKDKLGARKQSLSIESMDRGILDRWAELEQTESEKLERMETIERIAQKMKSIFLPSGTDSIYESGTFFHLAENAGKEPLLISYSLSNNGSIFGFSIDIACLRNETLPSILGEMTLEGGLVVQIADEEGHVIAGEEIPGERRSDPQTSVSQGFVDNFPPWTIEVLQISPSEAERQFGLRRNLYVLSVLVVIIAILFGGVLAIRSTAKELRLAKLKSEFVSTVSHEFRTPLTSIRYLAELLQRGRVDEESKKQVYYETITHESERLSRLIENILDFSKIEAGMKEYEFGATDVVEMCRDVVSRFQEQVAAQEFVIDSEISEELPKIFADRDALARALFNLLDNAVKYSGDNRKIEFRAWPDGDRIFLKVMDKGVGIKREDRQKVFEKFYRSGDVQSSSIKGSGIGLTLVLHIARAHGGEVILDSEPGKGTEVTILLPRERKS